MIEDSRYSDHRMQDLAAQVVTGSGLELLEDEGRDVFWFQHFGLTSGSVVQPVDASHPNDSIQ